MKVKLIVSSLAALGVLSQCPLAFGAAKDLNSATAPADADYPKVGGNLGNQNYSSLTQINKANLQNLGAVWKLDVSAASTTKPVPAAGTTDTGQQTSPLVIDGVIYSDTPVGGVIAVNGKTGAVKWKWTPSIGANGFGPTGTRRGVSVGDGKVFTLASGNRIVALDKETGDIVWVVQPTGAGGQSLGNVAKVGTVYYDGMVYIGTNDAGRNAGLAVRSSDGALQWYFFGAADTGFVVTDVNGVTYDAGDTWGSNPNPATGLSCALTAGAAPWMHPAVDPELNQVYWTFGNIRSCNSSQDASLRGGVGPHGNQPINLFGNSMVATDAKTGAYKWHFQSQRHGYHDMDNTQPPTVGEVVVDGQTRKVIYYGSKASETFIIDRVTGKEIRTVVERPVPQDSRQADLPFQPYPPTGAWLKDCIVYQPLSLTNIPGDPYRAVPNYNGYQAKARQPDGSLPLAFTPGSYIDADLPFLTIPPGYHGNNGELPTSDGNGGTTAAHRLGCLWDPHWDLPMLSTTTQNGGNDWSGSAFSPNLGLYITPYAINNVAHDRIEGSNGLRAPGQYQTGGYLALDAKTGQVVWNNFTGLDQAHGQTPLVTASGLVFWGQPDGWFVAADAATGKNLWKFQMGAGGGQGVATYTVDGEQYVVVEAFGSGTPYSGGSDGSTMWAFKLGGTVSEAPTPDPLVIRRNGGGTPTAGSTVSNTVYLARLNRTDTATQGRNSNVDAIGTGGMQPTNLGVPVGTTVTFLNPGADTFPNFPNLKEHCVTQFFEGLFNARLQPGESFQYEFDREGEYWYNDCTDPRPTGRVNVTAQEINVPGALTIVPSVLNLKPPTGVFTSVVGVINAVFELPSGYTLDTGYGAKVTMKTPLSDQVFEARSVSVTANGRRLTASFDKAVLDNNIPAGTAVPLTVSGLFLNNGVQKRLTSTGNARVIK
jgi:glucose dehydrogenase/plastocyanin